MNKLLKKDMNRLLNMSVLYCEDDRTVAESMNSILKNFFKEIFICFDGKEALELYQEKKVDLLIFDIRVPKIDGLHLCKLIREKDDKTPIIITTSYDDTNTLLNAIPLNLVDYLVKPVFMDKLTQSFERVLKFIDKNEKKVFHFSQEVYYDYNLKGIFDFSKDDYIKLTSSEYKLLELFLEKTSKVITTEEISESIYTEREFSFSSLRNVVLRVRNKLGEHDRIKTIKKVGYLWEE